MIHDEMIHIKASRIYKIKWHQWQSWLVCSWWASVWVRKYCDDVCCLICFWGASDISHCITSFLKHAMFAEVNFKFKNKHGPWTEWGWGSDVLMDFRFWCLETMAMFVHRSPIQTRMRLQRAGRTPAFGTFEEAWLVWTHYWWEAAV